MHCLSSQSLCGFLRACVREEPVAQRSLAAATAVGALGLHIQGAFHRVGTEALQGAGGRGGWQDLQHWRGNNAVLQHEAVSPTETGAA